MRPRQCIATEAAGRGTGSRPAGAGVGLAEVKVVFKGAVERMSEEADVAGGSGMLSCRQ